MAGYDFGFGGKPHPGMVLAFAATCHCRPDEVALIGDTLHDLRAARAAGAASIAVLTGPTRAAARPDLEPHADHVIDSDRRPAGAPRPPRPDRLTHIRRPRPAPRRPARRRATRARCAPDRRGPRATAVRACAPRNPLHGQPALGEAAAFLRQMQGMRAAVARKRPALDQSRLDEPVDEAGHVAFCDVKPFRQVLLHQALALREGGDKVELGIDSPIALSSAPIACVTRRLRRTKRNHTRRGSAKASCARSRRDIAAPWLGSKKVYMRTTEVARAECGPAYSPSTAATDKGLHVGR